MQGASVVPSGKGDARSMEEQGNPGSLRPAYVPRMIRLQVAQSYCREQLHFKDEDFYVRGLSTLVWTPQSLRKLIGLSNAEEHVLDVSHTMCLNAVLHDVCSASTHVVNDLVDGWKASETWKCIHDLVAEPSDVLGGNFFGPFIAVLPAFRHIIFLCLVECQDLHAHELAEALESGFCQPLSALSLLDCRCARGNQELRFCNPDALPELEFVSVKGSDVLCDPMGDLPSVASYEDSGGRWSTRDTHHYACTKLDMERGEKESSAPLRSRKKKGLARPSRSRKNGTQPTLEDAGFPSSEKLASSRRVHSPASGVYAVSDKEEDGMLHHPNCSYVSPAWKEVPAWSVNTGSSKCVRCGSIPGAPLKSVSK